MISTRTHPNTAEYDRNAPEYTRMHMQLFECGSDSDADGMYVISDKAGKVLNLLNPNNCQTKCILQLILRNQMGTADSTNKLHQYGITNCTFGMPIECAGIQCRSVECGTVQRI